LSLNWRRYRIHARAHIFEVLTSPEPKSHLLRRPRLDVPRIGRANSSPQPGLSWWLASPPKPRSWCLSPRGKPRSWCLASSWISQPFPARLA